MEKEKYSLSVNEKFDYHLSPSGFENFDLILKEDQVLHLLKDGKVYHAEIIFINKAAKKVAVKIDGQLFNIRIADAYDQLVDRMGLSASVIHKISEIKAPMPGLVLSIAVRPGQSIEHGDTLLVLEAMKMENILKSPGEGVVKTIHATTGKAVEKGEILIELE